MEAIGVPCLTCLMIDQVIPNLVSLLVEATGVRDHVCHFLMASGGHPISCKMTELNIHPGYQNKEWF